MAPLGRRLLEWFALAAALPRSAAHGRCNGGAGHSLDCAAGGDAPALLQVREVRGQHVALQPPLQRGGPEAGLGAELPEHLLASALISLSKLKQLGAVADDAPNVLGNSSGARSYTTQEFMAWCPKELDVFLSLARSALSGALEGEQLFCGGNPAACLIKQMMPTSMSMSTSWADQFTLAFYLEVVSLLTTRSFRHSNSINVPRLTGAVDDWRVGLLSTPFSDIDDPAAVREAQLSITFIQALTQNSRSCLAKLMRSLPFEDMLDDPVLNQWNLVLGAKYASKREWVKAWWFPKKMADGIPMWPASDNNLASHFLRTDMWDDGLEKSIAFDLIGTHRVKSVSKPFGDASLAYAVELNSFSSFETRPHFARYGGDMYFNMDGFPMLIQRPGGALVKRGDSDWQYWKFVWRSSLITTITVMEHLQFTHFRMGTIVTKAVRQALPPDHPYRRFLAVFTFGSIEVNNLAIDNLIDVGSPLHRSTAFLHFGKLLSKDAIGLLDVAYAKPFDEFFNASKWTAKPRLLRAAPYYADGRLLFDALTGLVKSYAAEFPVCNAQGEVVDAGMLGWFKELRRLETLSAYSDPGARPGVPSCKDVQTLLVTIVWSVTGWHRHVGMIGDYYVDPDLASFSWKEGEAFPRPRQHMLMSGIISYTGAPQPKINEDYSHVFAGMEGAARAQAVWQRFREELQGIQAVVAGRNQERKRQGRVLNRNADPSVVECSVAV